MSSNSGFQKFIFILFYFLIIFSNPKTSLSKTCKEGQYLSNTDCFTDVLIFNNMKCRAGHSALNKDGLFILEFSNDGETGDRVFYGLKPNGRYYFPNESPTKLITLEKKIDIIARYESMNAFISLKTDINKSKEYFLSISTYSCFLEIYDFTKDSVEYSTIYNYDYLGVQIFSFKFELLEYIYSNQVSYYLIFSHNIAKEPKGDKISVKKISFSSLEFNKNDITKTTTMDDKLNDRTVSGFLIDDIKF